MAHVTNFLGLLEKLQSADITVHQNRCAVVRNRNATCMKCAVVCTSGCISYDDNELIISNLNFKYDLNKFDLNADFVAAQITLDH